TPSALSYGAASPSLTPSALSYGAASPSLTPSALSCGAASPSLTPSALSYGGASPSLTPSALSLGGASPPFTCCTADDDGTRDEQERDASHCASRTRAEEYATAVAWEPFAWIVMQGRLGCWSAAPGHQCRTGAAADSSQRIRSEALAQLLEIKTRWSDGSAVRVVLAIRKERAAGAGPRLGQDGPDASDAEVIGARRLLDQEVPIGDVPGDAPAGIPAMPRTEDAAIRIRDARLVGRVRVGELTSIAQ